MASVSLAAKGFGFKAGGIRDWKEMQVLMRKSCEYGQTLGKDLGIRCRSNRNLMTCMAATGTGIGKFTQESRIEESRVCSYMFRVEGDGLVNVLVEAKRSNFVVKVDVLCDLVESELAMRYELLRYNSGRLVGDKGVGSVEVPLARRSAGSRFVELEFDAGLAPCYLSFVLQAVDGGVSMRTHRKRDFRVPIGLGRGCPVPLGVLVSEDGVVNFALFSKNAEGVVLSLYNDDEVSDPALEIELDPCVNRTGNIWHVSMKSIGSFVRYGYRCKGMALWDKGDRFHMRHVLLDPYARLTGNFVPDQGELVSLAKCLGSMEKEPVFDWGDDVHPGLSMEKLVVYRLNVAQFTKDKSSGLPEDLAGTFAGVAEKVEHLKALGVNAVLIEPVFPFDNEQGPYFPYNFFSVMNSYGSQENSASAILFMKEMVKKMHAHGIEVLLEVVYTHTMEGGDSEPKLISFRGIDNSSYYVIDRSGSTNRLRCYNSVVQQMILDSLQRFVVEFHVDGFCFVNSTFMSRGPCGDFLSRPPLIEAIAFDPILAKTKIVADCFSPLDMSSIEIQFPHWKRWAEINTKFCSDVRNFLRGEGLLSDLATRFCGSGDLFLSRGPSFSFNYVTRNFGLPLVDLVSFSNSELSSELSWNCGEEGPTNNRVVLDTRLKQIRNFLFILFMSLGVPVLSMGDECGYSAGGSCSYYDRKHFNWASLRTSFGRQTTQFIAFLSSFRKRRSDIFQNKSFLKVENIDWCGSNQSEPNWADPTCKFLAVTLKGDKTTEMSSKSNNDLFICFNAGDVTETVILPEQSEGTVWFRLVDTALQFPGFFSSDSDPKVHKILGSSTYELEPHSCALFETKIH